MEHAPHKHNHKHVLLYLNNDFPVNQWINAVVVVAKWSGFIWFVRFLFKLKFDIAMEWKSVSWNRIVQMPWHQKSEFIIINILLLFIHVITMCMMNYDVYIQSEPQQRRHKKKTTEKFEEKESKMFDSTREREKKTTAVQELAK